MWRPRDCGENSEKLPQEVRHSAHESRMEGYLTRERKVRGNFPRMQRGKEKGEMRLSSPGLASCLEEGSGREEGGLGEVFQEQRLKGPTRMARVQRTSCRAWA